MRTLVLTFTALSLFAQPAIRPVPPPGYALTHKGFFKPEDIRKAHTLLKHGLDRARSLAAGHAPWTMPFLIASSSSAPPASPSGLKPPPG
jgi:hypothetical protein